MWVLTPRDAAALQIFHGEASRNCEDHEIKGERYSEFTHNEKGTPCVGSLGARDMVV